MQKLIKQMETVIIFTFYTQANDTSFKSGKKISANTNQWQSRHGIVIKPFEFRNVFDDIG